ncbi:sensor histidine kinase [Xylanibacillus composti]|uniref:histidine kinase n=1 Tax=Xylanibacillus composti TaxID=1572762 RepID=A0A8J4GZ74_9BACL|nr:ATP-binding protein [Xylanibacillus composti]MDT9723993.1 sensor histidine kinase [Xylanibacillus composti]GIQ67874.1 hypothetical protein XYCOK13_06980 [Xylanibacillus composti]
MSWRSWKWFTVLVPTCLIGGFEFVRHEYLLEQLSMEYGNLFITLLTFLISWLFAQVMFRRLRIMNERVYAEKNRRAILEERERIARELHDQLAQNLFYINTMLSQGKKEEARAAVAETDQHLRQAIFNLRTGTDKPCSLHERLLGWLEEWQRASGIAVTQQIELEAGMLKPDEEIQLFAIVQELFTNIRKHSHADRASIVLKLNRREGLSLIVADDGRGLQQTDGGKAAYGLSIVRKRAAELGAELDIRGNADGGTTVEIKGKRGVDE